MMIRFSARDPNVLIEMPIANAPSRRTFTLRDYWFIAVTFSVVGAIILKIAGFALVSSFLALVLASLCGYPTVRYVVERERTVPAVPILGVAYAIQFAFPVFFSDGTLWLVGGFQAVDPASIDAALIMAIVSFVAFLGIVHSRRAVALVGKLPTMNLHLNRTRALVYVVLFSAGVLLSTRVFSSLSTESQVEYSGIYRVFANQLLIAIGVLAWLTYTSRSLWLRVAYYALVLAAVVDGLSTGFVEASVAPIGVMFAAEWIYRGRLNKGVIVFLIAAILLLNPVKADYREAIWFSAANSEMSRADKAMYWLQSGLDYWGDVLVGRTRIDDAALQLVRRTSMIDTLAHVYETTPQAVPYYMGRTYSYFLYSFIPRVLWPEKPVATANRTLAVDYDLTTEEGAERSTFGVSLLGEGYANFGWLGPILVMGVLAFALLALQRMFATAASGPGGYAVFFAFFIFFLNGLGSSAEILLGNVLQGMIASYILIYWVVDRRARKPRRSSP